MCEEMDFLTGDIFDKFGHLEKGPIQVSTWAPTVPLSQLTRFLSLETKIIPTPGKSKKGRVAKTFNLFQINRWLISFQQFHDRCVSSPQLSISVGNQWNNRDTILISCLDHRNDSSFCFKRYKKIFQSWIPLHVEQCTQRSSLWPLHF